jgi:hypothetical protein
MTSAVDGGGHLTHTRAALLCTYIEGKGVLKAVIYQQFFTETIQVTEGRMLTSPVPIHTASHTVRYPNWCIKREFTVADDLDQFCG